MIWNDEQVGIWKWSWATLSRRSKISLRISDPRPEFEPAVSQVQIMCYLCGKWLVSSIVYKCTWSTICTSYSL
jgi:hypothetical protein